MVIARPRLTTEEIVRLNREFTFFSWSAQAHINPLVMDRAKGVYFWDPDGKRYIDFNSQLMSVNIGHGDRRVIDAIERPGAQARLRRAAVRAPRPRARLGQMLAELAPGDLDKVFFTLGGAEANENAISMARMVTGRQKIIARYRSLPRGDAGAISVTGDPRRWAAEPGIPGVVRVPGPVPPLRREQNPSRWPSASPPRRGHPVRGAADDRGVHPRDGHRHQRHPDPARRLPPGRARAVHKVRHPDDRRRGDGRLRADRQAGSPSTTGTSCPT